MEELVDLIATDASASDVSDKIKDALMAKAAARIDALRPDIAATVCDGEAQRKKKYQMNNQLKRTNNETYHRRSLKSKIYH